MLRKTFHIPDMYVPIASCTLKRWKKAKLTQTAVKFILNQPGKYGAQFQIGIMREKLIIE